MTAAPRVRMGLVPAQPPAQPHTGSWLPPGARTRVVPPAAPVSLPAPAVLPAVAQTPAPAPLQQPPVAVRPAPQLTPLALWAGRLRAAAQWLGERKLQPFRGRRMRVAETVSLGEKRSVSILHVDGAQFLIGSSAAGVQLLAVLADGSTPEATPTR